MKKRILILCAALGISVLLCACKVKGNPLPAGMEEAVVLDTGRQVIADLNEGAFQNIYDQMREDARETTSPESIQAYMEGVWAEIGVYVSEETAMATGQKLKSGEKYATAVFYTKHEKDSAIYRIAFSSDMELLGIQIKNQ